MQTCVAYLRVSTEEQSREGVSIDMQRTRIKSYAEAMGLNLQRVLADEGVSGGKPLAERPQGALLMEMVRKKQIQAVIVYKLDRLGRTTLDVLQSIEEMDKKSVAIHSLSERLDSQSPIGRFVLRTLASLSEMERDTIRSRTKAALEHKRQTGRLAGRVPYGFNLASDGDTLLPNTKEQSQLSQIREYRDAGKSFNEIATVLNASNVPTKNGGVKWYASTVRSVLLHAAKKIA